MNTIDNSNKSILARACDPAMAQQAAAAIPPQIGNPEYVAATDDDDFVQKLRSRQWSIVFFAPGACRFSAAGQAIPGGNKKTSGWSLEDYRGLVRQTQGDETQIVETKTEAHTIELLALALTSAKGTEPQ